MAFIPGTPGPDTLFGTDDADTILGYGASDTLYGHYTTGGQAGSSGAERHHGDSGNDSPSGGSGYDTAIVAGGSLPAPIGDDGDARNVGAAAMARVGFVNESDHQLSAGSAADGPTLVSATQSLPSDPFFAQQWHLHNNQPGELDLNVTGVWPSYTGNGVTVAVIDDGFDYTHPDLAPNYNTSIDWDFEDADSDPSPSGGPTDDPHGTAVMGLVGAARNGADVVGVAYDSTLVGYRAAFLNQVADAIRQAANVGADVVNMSIGSQQPGNFFDEALSAALAADLASAIDHAVDEGRDDLGTILVKGAGNGRDDNPPHNANAASWNANFKTISVAATDAEGVVAPYSTPGANLLISAFGSPLQGSIVTTDRVGNAGYAPGDVTTTFNGTSAATPMVSGVVALMLDANPGLGWRDVQDILAYSARQTGGGNTWVENGTDTWKRPRASPTACGLRLRPGRCSHRSAPGRKLAGPEHQRQPSGQERQCPGSAAGRSRQQPGRPLWSPSARTRRSGVWSSPP